MSYHTCGWQKTWVTAQAPVLFTLFGLHHLSPPRPFFLNSPPLGQADRPARHEPRSLIQGEPIMHPLKHTRISCELRGPVSRQGTPKRLAPPASLTPPSLGIHRHLSHGCLLLLSPIPTHHQRSPPFLTKQELIIYTEGGHILRIMHPQGPRKEAR